MCRTTKGERSRTLFKSIALDEQRLSDRFSAVFLPTPSAQASEQKDAEGSPTRYANKLYLEIVFGVRILFDCANKIESDRSIRSVELSLYDRVCHLYASNTHTTKTASHPPYLSQDWQLAFQVTLVLTGFLPSSYPPVQTRKCNGAYDCAHWFAKEITT